MTNDTAPDDATPTDKTPDAGTNTTPDRPFAVLISKDLFFVSRITGTAAGFGWKVITDSPDNSVRHAQQSYCRGVLIDLTTPGLDIKSLVASIGDRISIAFGPHVQTKRLEDARLAGCTSVLPRSRFDSTLNEILKNVFGESSSSPTT